MWPVLAMKSHKLHAPGQPVYRYGVIGRLYRDFRVCVLDGSQEPGMEIGSVTGVEQIVRYKLVVRLNGNAVRLGEMSRRGVIYDAEVRDAGKVWRPIAHPNPNTRMLFDGRETTDLHLIWNDPIAMRVANTVSRAVELEAMVRTLDAFAI
jgi:hypothetical protein